MKKCLIIVLLLITVCLLSSCQTSAPDTAEATDASNSFPASIDPETLFDSIVTVSEGDYVVSDLPWFSPLEDITQIMEAHYQIRHTLEKDDSTDLIYQGTEYRLSDQTPIYGWPWLSISHNSTGGGLYSVQFPFIIEEKDDGRFQQLTDAMTQSASALKQAAAQEVSQDGILRYVTESQSYVMLQFLPHAEQDSYSKTLLFGEDELPQDFWEAYSGVIVIVRCPTPESYRIGGTD